MPDDSIDANVREAELPAPRVSVVRDGESIYKPGMKTWFVESADRGGNVRGTVSGGRVCECNAVTARYNPDTNETVCGCLSVFQGHRPVNTPGCSCDAICACYKVH